jgi:hypothetical protein
MLIEERVAAAHRAGVASMLAAFTAVGLTATFDLRGPGRGAYVALAPA